MLTVTIPDGEYFDQGTNEFVTVKKQVLQLEHSLVSISKWEAEWGKPFLSKETKTTAQTYDYVRCMTLTQNVNPVVYKFIPNDVIEKVTQYIDAPMTATSFSDNKTSGPREVITSELVYYWMVTLNIPFECQKWHLNRLLTFIRVCNTKNAPPKKMSQRDIYLRNKQLNAQRRAQLNSKG
jgi:hypothetical protein